MIIARSPLRISIGGGGTDLPSYYEEHGGFVLSAAIDKYVYITVHETFQPHFFVRYSSIESPVSVKDIRHPMIREALLRYEHEAPFLEITSLADIPAGTGLGSSGSFMTCLLKALAAYKRVSLTTEELAKAACHVEIDVLKESVGKQDQYIAAYGGLTSFHFEKDGTVRTEPAMLANDTLYALEDNLIMFFTGYTRKASDILKEQDAKTKEDDKSMIENLHLVKEIGLKIKDALEQNNPDAFGSLMHEHWLLKKKRSKTMSNDLINDIYEVAMKKGALGGKLIGAGGGGFLLFYCRDKIKVREAMREFGLNELRFRFDFEGTKVIV